MNFGNEGIKPQSQADGFSDTALDELTGQISGETDDELVEELADTVTIEKLLDTFIEEVSEMLSLAVETSLDGNPVRTHLELVTVASDVVQLAYELRGDLVRGVAVRAEEISEQNGLGATPISAATHASELRKQIIPDEEN